MDVSPPFSLSRLRLLRHSPKHQDQALTPVAGSSHNPDLLYADDDNDDAESTPRMSTSGIPDKHSPRPSFPADLPADNPTARLRALLARVPNSPNGSTPHASASRPLKLPSVSEPDSDFEPPHSVMTASSIARESLKELFSNALRDTPQKKNVRPRRNSIDTSEVDSPRVEEERASYRAKRRTLSDEEAEKSNPSGQSFRSSAAYAFDALRQRLDRSSSALPSLTDEQMVMDMSMPPLNSSTDTAMPRGAPSESPSNTSPPATSTPVRTFRMSTQLNMHSNLLDQDSEMQNELQGMDSYETAPVPRHRHSTPSLKDSAGPTPRPQPHTSARPLSWSSHSKSHSTHNLPPLVRRGSEDLDTSSSRPSSSLSNAEYKERVDETQRERERGWNSPVPTLPRSPAHPGKNYLTNRHSWGSAGGGRDSPAQRLSRKGSVASLTSTDDGRPSSRASSVASQADHKERANNFEQERNKEKERSWNRPHPKLSRSSSNLSLNKSKSDHIRTTSTPSRPESAASYLSPVRPKLQRQGSSSSLSSSGSRPGSPASSISNKSFEDFEEEVEHEIEHQRERNWNSPRPDWVNVNPLLHHRRSLSPLPQSRPGSPNGVPAEHPTISRSRINSITHGNRLNPSSSGGPSQVRISRPSSPMQHTSGDKSGSHARSKSPVLPTPPPVKELQNGVGSRFGWSFPQHKHKVNLPPLELDEEPPQKHPIRPPNGNSLHPSSATPSHIPIRSPRRNGHSSTASTSIIAEKKKSHRRSVTEFAESIGAIPPQIEISLNDELPPIPIVNGHDDFSYASDEESKIASSTPTAKPLSLPPELSTISASEPPAYVVNGHPPQVQNALDRPESPLTPPAAAAANSQPMFSLQTPPRRPQLRTPKAEYETPPPPSGMPDLPGPPSSEEEEEGDHTPSMPSRDLLGDLTAMKTPRPPGAWLATPAPSRQVSKEPVERANAAPPPDHSPTPSSDSGLATPPSTLSRATSLPPQTPAPPGGWVATPAPATTGRRRGSLLKVRFDLESETASEGVVERPVLESPDSEGLKQETAPPNNDVSASAFPDESSAEPPPTPPSLRERIRKKSPSIRVLDAYGREPGDATPPTPHVDTVPELAPVSPSGTRVSVPATPRTDVKALTTATPRNRSTVRVVDAMGREIDEEPAAEDSIVSESPLTHNEALSRMRDTISNMRQELSDADRSSDNALFDDRKYVALQEQCVAAQVARSNISKSLQIAQTVESKFTPFRSKIENGSLLPIGVGNGRFSRNTFSWRSLTGLILIQLVLLALMYRYSFVQAKKIFLTQYYDPFNPDLYPDLLKPDTILRTIPSCPTWSFSLFLSSLRNAGLMGVVSDAWHGASCAVASYLNSFWTGWSYPQDPVSYPWPPT